VQATRVFFLRSCREKSDLTAIEPAARGCSADATFHTRLPPTARTASLHPLQQEGRNGPEASWPRPEAGRSEGAGPRGGRSDFAGPQGGRLEGAARALVGAPVQVCLPKCFEHGGVRPFHQNSGLETLRGTPFHQNAGRSEAPVQVCLSQCFERGIPYREQVCISKRRADAVVDRRFRVSTPMARGRSTLFSR